MFHLNMDYKKECRLRKNKGETSLCYNLNEIYKKKSFLNPYVCEFKYTLYSYLIASGFYNCINILQHEFSY